MRHAVIVALGLAGCNQVLGLDPPSGRDGGAIVDATDATDATIDAVPCAGSTTCFRPGQTAQPGTECAADPVAACGDNRFRYCACGPAPLEGFAVFVEPNVDDATHSDLILVGKPGLGDLEVLVGGFCYGPAAPGCDLDLGACAASGRAMYIWNDLPFGAGQRTVRIFIDDINAPCTTADGGSILFDVSVTR